MKWDFFLCQEIKCSNLHNTPCIPRVWFRQKSICCALAQEWKILIMFFYFLFALSSYVDTEVLLSRGLNLGREEGKYQLPEIKVYPLREWLTIPDDSPGLGTEEIWAALIWGKHHTVLGPPLCPRWTGMWDRVKDMLRAKWTLQTLFAKQVDLRTSEIFMVFMCIPTYFLSKQMGIFAWVDLKPKKAS